LIASVFSHIREKSFHPCENRNYAKTENAGFAGVFVFLRLWHGKRYVSGVPANVASD